MGDGRRCGPPEQRRSPKRHGSARWGADGRRMVSVVPFEEPLTVAELTGAELRTLCRQGSGQQVAFGEPDWWHAHFSGVEWSER